MPLQIDELVHYNLTQNIPDGPWDPVYQLTYNCLGVDDGLHDGDDETAAMASDFGTQSSGAGRPPSSTPCP